MANKYTCWYRNDFYTDKLLLAEQYSHFLELPFYYGKECSLKLGTYQKAPADCKKEKMEYVELLITGILAVGQSMTALQLKSYLLLKNIAISNTVLKGTLERLIYRGMLERNTVWDGKTPFCKGENGNAARVTGFRLTPMGYAAAASLGVPGNGRKTDCQLNSQRGKLSRLTRSILWNQIILNQMLYNAGFSRFRVGEIQRLSHGKYMELPLYLKTTAGEYYFEYLHTMKNEVIEHTLSLWLEYAMRKEKPFTFVLASDRYDEALKIGSYMNRAKAAGVKLAVTSAVDWFREEAGVIMMASEFL